MGPPKENVKYIPVHQYPVESSNMNSSELSTPEAKCLLTKAESPDWSNTMANPDKQTNGGVETPNAQKQKVEQIEPKVNWKQIMGCIAANSVNIAGGTAMSFSSSLLPALQKEDSDIHITTAEGAWIASVIPLSTFPGALFGAFLMERFGRLATLQAATLPFCLAWAVLALAPNFTTILIGRIVMGFLMGIGPSAATVLITETALKRYRGPLAASGITYSSTGNLLGYVIGAVVDWRLAAWICFGFPVLSLGLTCLFTAESPLWLRSRGRTEAARRACMYYYGDPEFFVQPAVIRSPRPAPPLSIVSDCDVEKKAPEPVNTSNAPDPFFKQLWLLLKRPSGYKPVLILAAMFLLQQLSGIYITLFYAVSFFQTAGSPIDPYISTIFVGAMRLVACGMTIFLLAACSRRKMMILSSLGMAVCMAAAGYSTNLVLKENAGGDVSPLPKWFPVTCVVLYMLAASIGLQTIPWTMTAELFPQRVRGAAQAVNLGIANILIFLVLQAYPMINYILGGAVNVQYAFAGASFLSALLCWIFLPETHSKTLSEIEEYFLHNTIYLRRKK